MYDCDCGYEKKYNNLKGLFEKLKKEKIRLQEEVDCLKFGEEIQSLKIEIEKLKDENKELKSRALVNPVKVTGEQVKKIKELRKEGLSFRAIAKEVKLSTCTISRALDGVYDK